VTQILGQGGFGAVFEVVDLTSKTQDVYALKVSTDNEILSILSNYNFSKQIELEPTDPDEAGLLLEAGVLKRLENNYHFPRFIKCAMHGNLTYLVMQLCGDSLYFLRRSCTRRRFTLNTTLQLSMQTFEAIEYMHRMDLLHRDIKPGVHDLESPHWSFCTYSSVTQKTSLSALLLKIVTPYIWSILDLCGSFD